MTDAKQRRFRYGVQVNSLGLTEAAAGEQRQRIVLEMLAVTLSKDARARAVQLPAWNEALGLPRRGTSNGACACSKCSPSSPTCSSTTTSSPVGRRRGQRSRSSWPVPGGDGQDRGHGRRGPGRRERLHEVRPRRLARLAPTAHRGRRDIVVGVNRFETTEPNPLTADLDTAIQTVDAGVEKAAAEAVRRWRDERDADPARRDRAAAALARLKADAASDTNLMAASLECARAG